MEIKENMRPSQFANSARDQNQHSKNEAVLDQNVSLLDESAFEASKRSTRKFYKVVGVKQ